MRFVHFSNYPDPPRYHESWDSQRSGSAPYGVSAYPIDARMMSYAIDRDYVHTLEPAKGSVVLDLSNYHSYDEDRETLSDLIGEDDLADIERRWARYGDRFYGPREAAKLWYVITKAFPSDDPEDQEWGVPGVIHDPKRASSLLRDLGYDWVFDRHGVIYSGEPEQALFLSDDSFRVIKSASVIRANPALSDEELEDAWIDWAFENFSRMDELEAHGYKWHYIVTGEMPELSVEHAVIEGEFPYGDIVITKRPVFMKERLKPITPETTRESTTQRLLWFFGEHPIELVDRHGGVALIHRATRPGVEWQGSKFDSRGPYGHVEAQTREDAVRQLVGDGFKEPSPGALDQLLASREVDWWVPYQPKKNPPSWKDEALQAAQALR